MLPKKKNRARHPLVFMCLLAYLLAAVGNGPALPSFFMIMEGPHAVFATERYNHICFVFQHPGSKDEPESPTSARGEHKHDDNVLADTTPGPVGSPDHDIDIPTQKQFVSSSVKANEVSKSLSPSVTVQTVPVLENTPSTGFPPDSFPKINSVFASHRATVLLI